EEGDRRGIRRPPWTNDVLLINVEFGIQMCREGVARRQLLGDLTCGLWTQTLVLIQLGELGQLLARHRRQFSLLLGDQRSLAVALAAHRHVLPESHRKSAADQSRNSCSADGHEQRGWARPPGAHPRRQPKSPTPRRCHHWLQARLLVAS